MIILGIDHGDVRTGVAVCDKNEILASPVTVITERRDEALAQKIAALAEELQAEEIVMGLPKNMDGSVGFRAQAIEAFAETLRAAVDIPVVLRDERPRKKAQADRGRRERRADFRGLPRLEETSFQ